MSPIEVVNYGTVDAHRETPIDPSKCLWVDDCKPAPTGFAIARSYDTALRMLRSFDYAELYLDHDLGETRTGYDLLMQLIAEGKVPARVECISWNPAGRKHILAALENFRVSAVNKQSDTINTKGESE